MYYHIDQYQISVMYAHQALSLFTEQPLMQEKMAWCYSVIAGNYLSKLQYADALTYFKNPILMHSRRKTNTLYPLRSLT